MNEPTADPAVPADGSCAVCGGPRRTAGVKALYRKAAEDDPFCSTACAREWHGVELTSTAPRVRRAYVSQLAEGG